MSFREWPSLGMGNYTKSPFNVAYFYIKTHRPITTGFVVKNIRVS